MLPSSVLFSVLTFLAGAQAATKDQWRSRSVYQLLTDRFAPPTPDKQCDLRSYCGGTWQTLISRLDYLQNAGFDAVWISPTGLGLEGFTKWGENYHGFWTVDPFAPNPHYGSAADLKALSAALHARGMYLMVDIAVNHLASTDTDISDAALARKSDGKLLFQKESNFHPACGINWGNQESEQKCWLAQDGVALMDLKTEDSAVAESLRKKFAAYMAEYGIDGARVDASKHMTKQFQHDFCSGANTFCIGEVYDDSTAVAAAYTNGDGIDSVFGFGMMWGAVDVFAKDKPMSALSRRAQEANSEYADATLIGAILDNHDLPRFNSLASDKSNVYNAMALQFLFGGIPTMYYGLEQDISFGAHDPENRAPLWQYGNFQTAGDSYKRVARLNLIRRKMGELGGFHEVIGKEVGATDDDIAFERNGALLVLTKRGAGQGGDWTINKAGFPTDAKLVDLLSCSTAAADPDGSLKVTFNNGFPFFYVTKDIADQTEICGKIPSSSFSSASSSASLSASASSSSSVSVSASASTSVSSSSAGVASPSPGSPVASSSSSQVSQDPASTSCPPGSTPSAPIKEGSAAEPDQPQPGPEDPSLPPSSDPNGPNDPNAGYPAEQPQSLSSSASATATKEAAIGSPSQPGINPKPPASSGSGSGNGNGQGSGQTSGACKRRIVRKRGMSSKSSRSSSGLARSS
ncbi:putative alpha-amylase AmyA [Dioszegia hungarica]|uniref:alpha-amylase n=1 Tax=Dioszegia hungarica TaxID=4972 RepID=A0AA38H4F2_9TREE|nr:putative alpha-amylase AmyA [Dioszegia hungarica]KAI9634322.1 putative alpha-amylase AmyA [Dioszegia hungarica]